MKHPKIVVIGSINMDLVTETPRVPALGETVLGSRFSTLPGGKGANQAVACARLGAEVRMVGCVGDDSFGRELMNNLQQEGVCVDDVEPVTDVATGIASIVVENGDNSIIVVPGANHAVTVDKVRQAEAAIREADAILLQLEIPLEAVAEAVHIASRHHVPVIVNPAPATKLPDDVLQKITILTPNEYELGILLDKHSEEVAAFKEIMAEYPGTIVMTKGEDGAYYSADEKSVAHQPGCKVEVVDTTGAGDTFNAALAVMIGRDYPLADAVRYAVAASALSVTKFGAQGGMPSHGQVEAFLQQRSE
ncbi:ribokinase [Aneurinibacillus aneurinilyticus]|jgi:ribokinase|uniref:Ribokinase n=2 Tax=Aneurinibacillus aneurinilyticus TaxID=1391 RepID=A0A848CV19_ANEAE|nr:ribokinase [Aneurinibacillus aneurinilyticus]ERI07131.1 ribokinase [Aneurinibacillus aneurinilyticus ATCC 12856]MCI1693476.1 ribokinase [Aneurinibacillus aneurinilyticus]MED0672521.1 ribokinase [Aneurinibacillus aneurinilyticus]MED0704526.1 ribokinase [Aneurinibacillus aneurinilyticus]MED0725166.1 ribokinase [Aneurinibacillus aneurinilyticus]